MNAPSRRQQARKRLEGQVAADSALRSGNDRILELLARSGEDPALVEFYTAAGEKLKARLTERIATNRRDLDTLRSAGDGRS